MANRRVHPGRKLLGFFEEREKLAVALLFQILDRDEAEGCRVDAVAEAGRGWLVGAALSIADLKAVHLIDKLTNGSLAGLRTDALDDFPQLAAWRQRVHAERARRLPA